MKISQNYHKKIEKVVLVSKYLKRFRLDDNICPSQKDTFECFKC